MSALFGKPLSVLNEGIASFADAIVQRGGAATRLEWAPPAEGDRKLGMALARLVGHPAVEAANAKAAERYLEAQPRLEGIGVAREVLPGMGERMILHAGPPIAWEDMCGPMRAGVVGAALLEGWADTPEAAERMAGAGEIAFEPCHHHDAVGPMAGIISASMPLIVAEDPATGARAYSNLNEGAGRCLRYGALGDDVMERLRWMNERLGPSLRCGKICDKFIVRRCGGWVFFQLIAALGRQQSSDVGALRFRKIREVFFERFSRQFVFLERVITVSAPEISVFSGI